MKDDGFLVLWAQQTLHRTGTDSSVSIDVVLQRINERFWIELKYAERMSLATAMELASDSLGKYRLAAETHQHWNLDKRLGGGRVSAPNGFGCLGVRKSGPWTLRIPGVGSFMSTSVRVAAVPEVRRQTTTRSRATPQHREESKTSRTKSDRKRNREALRTAPSERPRTQRRKPDSHEDNATLGWKTYVTPRL